MCRSRQELSNEYLLAKFGVDTAENEPLEVWGKIQFIFHLLPRSGIDPAQRPGAAAERMNPDSFANPRRYNPQTPAAVVSRKRTEEDFVCVRRDM